MRGTERYLSAGTAAREEARRRALLVGIGALTLLGTMPVFGHHLAARAESFLRGVDHVGELCLVALHYLLAPVHEAFQVVFAIGLAYALWDRVRAWTRMRRVLGVLETERPAPGDALWPAIRHAGVDPEDVRVVTGLPTPAFTAGWLRPRIYVARELPEYVSPAGLVAVLAHEGAHLARRHPLRLSLVRFFASLLFWIPALRRLADDLADEAEIEADDAAARGEPLVLASAILSLATWAEPRTPTGHRLAGTIGFTRHDLLERRIRRLAGEPTPLGTRVTRRSLVSAVLALALVWTSGAVVVHPLPSSPSAHALASVALHTGPKRDCTQHDGPVILHLFCPGLSFGPLHHHCPHAEL